MSGDQQWVAEILEDINRRGQNRGGETGTRERDRDRVKDVPGARAEIARGLLQPGIIARENVRDQLVRERKKRNRLNAPQSAETQDQRRLTKDTLRDHTARTE